MVLEYHKSLSARRAWIEIFVLVAMLTTITSLSARRAWIEIHLLKYQSQRL